MQIPKEIGKPRSIPPGNVGGYLMLRRRACPFSEIGLDTVNMRFLWQPSQQAGPPLVLYTGSIIAALTLTGTQNSAVKDCRCRVPSCMCGHEVEDNVARGKSSHNRCQARDFYLFGSFAQVAVASDSAPA